MVSNTLELLEKEILRLKSKISTDSFMYGYSEIKVMALVSIRKLNTAGIKCVALIKGRHS